METFLNSKYESILPSGFDFYDTGRIEITTNNWNLNHSELDSFLNDSLGVAFNVYSLDSDLKLLFITVFDRGLEIDLYTELSNTLASKFSDRLAQEENADFMISPPHMVQSNALIKVIKSSAAMIQRSYIHAHNKLMIPVKVFILPASNPQEAANA